MPKFHFIFLLLLLFSQLTKAQDTIAKIDPDTNFLELNSLYRGSNVYLFNPAINSQEFCIQKITVNDSTIKFDKSSGIIIWLRDMNFKESDSLNIKIFHHNNCKPRVLPSQECYSKSPYQINEIGRIKADVIYWQINYAIPNSKFFIETFKWNKWTVLGELSANDSILNKIYIYKIDPHSGLNKIRIRSIDEKSNYTFSKQFSFQNSVSQITYSINQPSHLIDFSSSTSFEIFDATGNLILKGREKTINCKKLPKGNYFLNYDNEMTEFNLY